MINIRKARSSDVKSLTELMIEYHDEMMSMWRNNDELLYNFRKESEINSYKRSQLIRFRNDVKSKNELIIVAETNKSIIGFIDILFLKRKNLLVNKHGFVNDLFVLKNYRKKGVAQLLFDKAKECFKSKKINYVLLDVSVFNNKAISFYKKNNFKEMDIGMLSII